MSTFGANNIILNKYIFLKKRGLFLNKYIFLKKRGLFLTQECVRLWISWIFADLGGIPPICEKTQCRPISIIISPHHHRLVRFLSTLLTFVNHLTASTQPAKLKTRFFGDIFGVYYPSRRYNVPLILKIISRNFPIFLYFLINFCMS